MNEPPFEVQSLILPDVLTVSQFVDRHRPHRSPLQRVSYALLDLSLTDLKLRGNRRRPGQPAVLNGGRGNEVLIARKSRNYADARAWLLDTQADSLFSFRGVCEVLGIEPDSFRARVLELLRQREVA